MPRGDEAKTKTPARDMGVSSRRPSPSSGKRPKKFQSNSKGGFERAIRRRGSPVCLEARATSKRHLFMVFEITGGPIPPEKQAARTDRGTARKWFSESRLVFAFPCSAGNGGRRAFREPIVVSKASARAGSHGRVGGSGPSPPPSPVLNGGWASVRSGWLFDFAVARDFFRVRLKLARGKLRDPGPVATYAARTWPPRLEI